MVSSPTSAPLFKASVPRFVLQSQLYSSVNDRTQVDRELEVLFLTGNLYNFKMQKLIVLPLYPFCIPNGIIIQGAFVTALREGYWVLLDEVNLAPPEILGRLIGVFEGVRGSLCLAERGDVMGIPRNLKLCLLACMNPATDAGKRDLPFFFRSRFTEYAVDDDMCDDALEIFVRRFLGGRESDSKLVGNIACFYKESKRLSEEILQDGANQKPQYSLRSLYHALEYPIKA